MDTKRSTNERETNTRLGFTFVSFAIFCGTGFKFLCAFSRLFLLVPSHLRVRAHRVRSRPFVVPIRGPFFAAIQLLEMRASIVRAVPSEL